MTLLRNHEVNRTRERGVRCRPGHAYDTTARGGTSTVASTFGGSVEHVMGEPGRHPDELLRRRDAVGLVGHLRGDRQRPRRRRRLHPVAVQPVLATSAASGTATSSRCRCTARPTASRSPRPVGSRTSRWPGTRTPRRCTSARTTSPSRPASTSTSRRQVRARAGRLVWTAASSTCSRSRASPTPTWRATAGRARRSRSSGCASTSRTSTSAARRRLAANEDQRRGDPLRQLAGLGQRARPSSPGSRAPSTTTAGSTSPRPRAASAEPDPARHDRRLRQGLGPDLGLRHEDEEAAHALRVAERRGARLPGQRHDQQARHAGDLRGRRRRQLPARADPQGHICDIAQNRLFGRPIASPAYAPSVERRVRRLDVQPGRAHAVRQHPGEPRHLAARSGVRGSGSGSDSPGAARRRAGADPARRPCHTGARDHRCRDRRRRRRRASARR